MFNPNPDCKISDFEVKEFSDLLKLPPIYEVLSRTGT